MKQLKSEDFLSKLCKDSFAGYASTQIKKARGLKKKIINPQPKERKTLLDFCYVLKDYSTVPLVDWLDENNISQEKCGLINIPHSKGLYALFYNEQPVYSGIMKKETSNELSISSIPKDERQLAYLYFNQDAYSSYCKDYREYWDWMEKRNEERYNTNCEHGKDYDSKNMMHTIRLLQSAVKILATGSLNIRVSNRDELLDIKAGKMEYNELLVMAENMLLDIEKLYCTSTLPEKPDSKKTTQILVEIRTILYC